MTADQRSTGAGFWSRIDRFQGFAVRFLSAPILLLRASGVGGAGSQTFSERFGIREVGHAASCRLYYYYIML
jgi:hypothetical protein